MTTPDSRLVSFSETLGASLGADSPFTTSTFELDNSSSPVVHLEAFAISESDQGDTPGVQLLAVHENGDGSWYNGSLDKELCSFRTSLPDNEKVLFAKVTNTVKLKKGLLKHRADVLASIGAIESETQNNVLILLKRNNSASRKREDAALALHIYKLSIPTADPNMSPGRSQRNLDALASLDILEQSHLQESESSFTLHIASGTLYQQTPNLLTLYDLTGFLPRIAHNLALSKEDISSCLRLSPFTLALSGHSSFSLIRLPHCFLQAEHGLKPGPPAEQEPLRLLSYIASLNVIVAIKDRSLITIRQPDFNMKSGAFGKRKREGTLMDAIGQGTCAVAQVQANNGKSGRSMRKLGTLLATSEDQSWETIETKLDALFLEEGVETFCDSTMGHNADQPLRGNNDDDQSKMIYLCSKLFTVNRHNVAAKRELGLELTRLDHQELEAIFNWLLHRKLFTSDRLENSLKKSGSLHPSESLESGATIKALTGKVPSFKLLTSLIASEIPLNLRELATALAAVTLHWDSSAGSSGDQKLLTDTGQHPDAMQTDTSDIHPGSLENGPSFASTAGNSTHRLLYLILSRFYHLPQTSIKSVLRTHLTKTHLLQLVDILRIEIAQSGWLSTYDDDLTPSTAFSTPNDQLAHITHLLNSAIDAIGAGGWMLGSVSGSGSGSNDQMTETADTISYMKAEISAALEGIEEAVYLKGMLAEVLLCGKEALLSSSSSSKIPKGGATSAAAALPSRKKNVPLQTMALPTVESSSNALPLGLKLDQKVTLTKVGAGGELIGRSKRDIGRLKSKMVGKYSFERIVL